MCGIVGICQRDGEPVALNLLKQMTSTIAHRGPDDEGYYVHGNVGLGHRRLSIIDLSPLGRQPMSNEDGRLLITYNGELFNFQELRVRLQALGHRFRSQTDTEVIVNAYEAWGASCLEWFNGQFAFAIWDELHQRLFIARDRFGVKPLYYYHNERSFIFASEIKAILLHPDVKRAVNYSALNEYFTFQNILSDASLFEGVRLLPAGCSLTLDVPQLQPLQPPHQHRYWDFCFPAQPIQIGEEEAAEEVHRLFKQAVARQLMSDVPVGSYLSSGMDSGSITAVARQHLDRITTFTCGFDLTSASGLELSFDERARAEMLANLYKTEHYEVVLHAGDMEQVMPALIWHLEDLRVGQCYPNYYVARLAGKFVKVVLSGAGGDELFGGYPWRYYRGLNSHSATDFYRNYYDFWQRLVPDEEKQHLFRPSISNHIDADATFDTFRHVIEAAQPTLSTNEDFVNASLYFELKTFLHGLLVVEDKISMAHSLETRVPFLDNDLVDFALQLPARYKLRSLNAPAPVVDEDDLAKKRQAEFQTDDGKVVLRRAMGRFMPAEIAQRTKQGFSAPDASWFRGESIDYINTLLGDPRARVYEYLEPAFVQQRLLEHSSGHRNHRLFIWSLLSFEWWLRKFIAL
jgi:asparagine synthase (glutamine-hydrolysing)